MGSLSALIVVQAGICDGAAGGHLIDRHVGKSDADLTARLNLDPKIKAASSFPNRATAERAVSSALDANSAKISQFLNGTRGRLVIKHNVGNPVGNVGSGPINCLEAAGPA